ncbi:hypothetical protein [Clostridium sp.]|uniref:hypothetical protein n=1 Tax=Clostridium sp. TaxID=1506 RepID=UPI002FC8EA25
MDKNHLIERIIRQTIGNKGKVTFMFSGNVENIEKFFNKTMRIFRKKIFEGYDVSPEYYLIDFYTYMMLCKGWNIVDLNNELFNCKRSYMTIIKHLEEIDNNVMSRQVNDYLDRYNIGI